MNLSFRRSQISFFILILFGFVAFLVFGNSLPNPFHFDDLRQIQNNSHLRGSFFAWLGSGIRFGYRFIPYLTFWLNARISGLSPVSFHTVNIFLHSLNAWLAFLVFLRLIKRFHVYPSGRDASFWLALFAAGLFLIHPLASELINQVVLRTELLALTFTLLGMWLYLGAENEALSRWRWAIVLALALAAIDSKSSAIYFPALLVVLSAMGPESIPKRETLVWTGITAFAASALMIRGVIWQREGGSLLSYALTQPGVVARYLWLFVFPDGLSVDYDIRPVTGFGLAFLLPMVLLSCLAAGLFSLGKRGKYYGFLGLWVLLAVAPSSSFVPRQDLMFSYRFYPAAVPWALLLVSLLFPKEKVPVDPQCRGVLGLFLSLMVVFSLLSFQRNQLFQDDLQLWQSALRVAPGKRRVQNNFGQALLKRGRISEAIAQFQKMKHQWGDDPGILSNLAAAYLQAGDSAEAIFYSQQAMARNPGSPELVRNAALALASASQKALAVQVIQSFLESKLGPSADLYLLLGQYQTELKNFSAAKEALEKARDLAPNRVEILLAMAELRSASGDPGNAKGLYFRAMALDPADPQVRNALGLFYKHQGAPADAEAAFLSAVAVDPHYVFSMNNLGNLYFAQNKFDLARHWYERAEEVYPTAPLIKYHLALLRNQERSHAGGAEHP